MKHYETDIVRLLQTFPEDWKTELPIAFFQAKHNYSRSSSISTEPSNKYNTKQLACYWFYKPVTLMYKTPGIK